MSGRKRNPPLTLDMGFDEAIRRFAQTKPEEISLNANKINVVAPKMPSKECPYPVSAGKPSAPHA